MEIQEAQVVDAERREREAQEEKAQEILFRDRQRKAAEHRLASTIRYEEQRVTRYTAAVDKYSKALELLADVPGSSLMADPVAVIGVRLREARKVLAAAQQELAAAREKQARSGSSNAKVKAKTKSS